MKYMAVGIPLGMSIGMGSGIAIGAGVGKRQAQVRIEQNIRDLALTHRIDVTGPGGTGLSVDEFIKTVCNEGEQAVPQVNQKAAVWIAVGLGLVLFGAAVLFFLLRT